MVVRRIRSHLLRNSQHRWPFNLNLLEIKSRNESGVTGFIFHLSVDRTRISILVMVLASNRYLLSST